MKKSLQIFMYCFLLLNALAFKVLAQLPCNISPNFSPSQSVCIGVPVNITAIPSGINLGNGANGALTVNSTVFTDAIKSAVSGGIGVIGSNSITVASSTGMAIGDEVIIITMQDATVGAGNLVGQYEFRNISGISGNTLTFSQTLTKAFVASATVKHQVVEVNQYTNITVASGGSLTCSAWDGTVGGVLCFRASGTVNINAGGFISASGKGYRGVTQKAAYWRNADGGQGEGIYGTGVGSSANGASIGNNSGAWTLTNGNGGGGGTGRQDAGGGGGGGYGAAGTIGTNGGHTPGAGGLAVGNSSLSLLMFGGAGGEGGTNTSGPYSASNSSGPTP